MGWKRKRSSIENNGLSFSSVPDWLAQPYCSPSRLSNLMPTGPGFAGWRLSLAIRVTDSENAVPDSATRVTDSKTGVLNSATRVADSEIAVPNSAIRVADSEIGVANSAIRVTDSEIGVLNSAARVADSEIGVMDSEPTPEPRSALAPSYHKAV